MAIYRRRSRGIPRRRPRSRMSRRGSRRSFTANAMRSHRKNRQHKRGRPMRGGTRL